MSMRQELYPAEPDETLVDQLSKLAGDIVAYLDTRRDYAPLIDSFNALTASQLTIADFEAMAGSMDTEEFVRECLCPYPKIHHDVTDAEYLEIIHGFREFEIPHHEYTYWETFLEINLRCTSIGDLLADDDLTDDEVLSKAKSKGPILL